MNISTAHLRADRRLAILGGQPLFPEPIHVGRPNIGDREQFLSHVRGMLDRRWFTNNGPLAQEFEREICRLTGAQYCVAMCNATVALEIAARGLGLTGEVIVPSYTFVATAHCLQWQQITPVFCDIDPHTHNMDPTAVERLITPRTTGIVGVHVWGRPCDTQALDEVASRHGLKVMYDAAHAIGCSDRRGVMVGNFGSCEVFSFHATKIINSFEGGAIVTNDGELATRLRLMRNFGFSGLDRVTYIGTNGKMTEVCAAMGLTSLGSIDQLVEVNRRNWVSYGLQLQDIPGLTLIEYDPECRNNYQYIVVEVDAEVCPLQRDELVDVLSAEGILARRYFWPGVHRMEPYRSLQPNAGLMLPHTERIAPRVMVLPNGDGIDETVITTIGNVVRSALADPQLIRAALRRQGA